MVMSNSSYALINRDLSSTSSSSLLSFSSSRSSYNFMIMTSSKFIRINHHILFQGTALTCEGILIVVAPNKVSGNSSSVLN